MTINEAKEKLAAEIEKSAVIWASTEAVRRAQDEALKPWHEANRRIDGYKGIIALLESETK